MITAHSCGLVDGKQILMIPWYHNVFPAGNDQCSQGTVHVEFAHANHEPKNICLDHTPNPPQLLGKNSPKAWAHTNLRSYSNEPRGSNKGIYRSFVNVQEKSNVTFYLLYTSAHGVQVAWRMLHEFERQRCLALHIDRILKFVFLLSICWWLICSS